jgi:hypothetical protein
VYCVRARMREDMLRKMGPQDGANTVLGKVATSHPPHPDVPRSAKLAVTTQRYAYYCSLFSGPISTALNDAWLLIRHETSGDDQTLRARRTCRPTLYHKAFGSPADYIPKYSTGTISLKSCSRGCIALKLYTTRGQ